MLVRQSLSAPFLVALCFLQVRQTACNIILNKISQISIWIRIYSYSKVPIASESYVYKNHVINVNQMVKYAPSRCAIQQKRIYNKTIENFHDTLPRFCHFCEQTSKQSSTITVSSVVLLWWLRFNVVLNEIPCHLPLGEYTFSVHSLKVVRLDCLHLILVELSV